MRGPDRFPKTLVDRVTRYGGDERFVVIAKNQSGESLGLVFVLCTSISRVSTHTHFQLFLETNERVDQCLA